MSNFKRRNRTEDTDKRESGKSELRRDLYKTEVFEKEKEKKEWVRIEVTIHVKIKGNKTMS